MGISLADISTKLPAWMNEIQAGQYTAERIKNGEIRLARADAKMLYITGIMVMMVR